MMREAITFSAAAATAVAAVAAATALGGPAHAQPWQGEKPPDCSKDLDWVGRPLEADRAGEWRIIAECDRSTKLNGKDNGGRGARVELWRPGNPNNADQKAGMEFKPYGEHVEIYNVTKQQAYYTISFGDKTIEPIDGTIDPGKFNWFWAQHDCIDNPYKMPAYCEKQYRYKNLKVKEGTRIRISLCFRDGSVCARATGKA